VRGSTEDERAGAMIKSWERMHEAKKEEKKRRREEIAHTKISKEAPRKRHTYI